MFFTTVSNVLVYGQAPGNTCATAVPFTLPTLPGAPNATTSGAQTTNGRGNNYAAGTYCTSANYGDGADGVYSITVPAGGGNYTFTFPDSGNTWKILSIHSACVITNANCIGGFTTGGGSDGTTTLGFAAGTYYLVIDTWPAPNFANFTLTVTLNAPPTSYCTPAPTSVDANGITNVSFSTVNNTTGAEAGNYGDYSDMVGAGTEGAVLPINITYQTGYTYDTTIWVDWNDDFVFSPGEVAYTGTSLGANPTTLAASITIPVGASTSGLGTGLHRMRIGGMDFGPMTNPCYTGTYACFEDYTISTAVPGPCATPTAQPTNLTFNTITDTSIDGSFTAAAPAASSYLVLANITGTTPTVPSDGTNYSIGNTALGATVIDNDVNLNFSATGLNPNTTYYFFIYSFNYNGCSGGPLYNTVSPLPGNETTDLYCTPSSSDPGFYIDDFITTGATTNINHTGTGFSTNGYGNFTALTVEQFPSMDIDFTINFIGGSFETNIWVDWNSDGDFVDAGEKVYDSPGYTDPTIGSFTVPGVAGGSYRMRVRSDWLTGNPSPCGFDDDSETHDYTLIVTPLNCTADPQSLTAVLTTTTTATVSWNAPTPIPDNGYEYIISTDNTTTTPAGDITGTTAGTSINLTGLTLGTTYYVFVRGVCNATDNGIWVTISFNTGCADLDTTPNSCEMVIDQLGTDPFAITPYNPNPSFALDCSTASVDLATNAQMHETTSYDVIKIPYTYINSFGGTVNNSTIANDDQWADLPTAIGFPFCFYENEYDYTLAGANSLLTFDINEPGAPYFLTGTNTPGSNCGYDFSNNLPSTVDDLFEQTIYGVYHDIDPEGLPANAMTTRTQGIVGCRKFIAEWNDIPMYSDNSILYSGMIVLYETTNIIEVYIEEKRIDNNNVSPWNDGNAIVGIQGDYVGPVTNPANEYAVAPCRNGLDTNWEVTNEAWRFVPSGNSRLTVVEWYIGTDTSGAPDATTNTYTATAPGTYTAISTYSTCGGPPVTLTDEVVVTTGGKTWNGSVDDNWYIANNWTPTGVPTSADCVVIPATAASNGNAPIADKLSAPPIPLPPAEARNLTLLANAYLEIDKETELIVQEWVTVQNTGILSLKNSSSLIQVDDAAVNSGDIHMQRSPNFNESAVLGTEYVYWSSPVSGFQVTAISPSSSQLYDWTPTVANGTAGNHGEWLSATGSMTDGTGYIVRGLDGTPATIPATAYAISNNTALFSGVPNNGVITKPLFHGGYDSGPYAGIGNGATNEDDNWNLLGNPYPSSISADVFASLNTNINGTVYVWPHNSTYSTVTLDPFYENYVYNYDGNDYTEYNSTGSNPPGLNDYYIGSGQAFFVMMNHSATSGSNITFNNSMREVLSTYNNSTFFRTNDLENDTNRTVTERHRIWLDLLSPTTITNTILVGYVQNATNNFDRLYDGYDFSSGDNSGFYSLLNNETLSIQGRSLPFMQEDIVPLGIIANETGSHTIAINTLDGLFISENQNIYLEDTELNMIHDIRLSPYTFTIDAGIHNNRFLLRYTNESLGVNELDDNNSISIIAPKSDYIKVTSEIGTINSVAIYDIVGRLIFTTEDINQSEFILNQTRLSDGTYIVKVELYNGKQKIQKVVIRQ